MSLFNGSAPHQSNGEYAKPEVKLYLGNALANQQIFHL